MHIEYWRNNLRQIFNNCYWSCSIYSCFYYHIWLQQPSLLCIEIIVGCSNNSSERTNESSSSHHLECEFQIQITLDLLIAESPIFSSSRFSMKFSNTHTIRKYFFKGRKVVTLNAVALLTSKEKPKTNPCFFIEIVRSFSL